MLLRVDGDSDSPEYFTTAVQTAHVDFPPLAKAEGLPISRKFHVLVVYAKIWHCIIAG